MIDIALDNNNMIAVFGYIMMLAIRAQFYASVYSSAMKVYVTRHK